MLQGGDGNRRDFIKKGAMVGGLVWATPAIVGVAQASAQAALYGPCPCANCRAFAVGLIAPDLTFGTASGTGCRCQRPSDVDPSTFRGVIAQSVCAKADDATCTASVLVEGLQVQIPLQPDDPVLEVGVLGSCVSCGTGTSYVADIFMVTTDNQGNEKTRTPVDVPTGCNVQTFLPDFNISVGFNEQRCDNGRLTVTALTVIEPGVVVLAAQVAAGAPGCTCMVCSPTPTCTPPRAREAICP